jgi:hypothetical protein
MDPFIESQRWDDFHAALLPVLRELLVPQVRPRYTVDVERHVYLVDESGESTARYVPDAAVVHRGELPDSELTASTATLEPHLLTIPMPAEYKQKYLAVRTRGGHEPVCLIEVLSPCNKSAGEGQQEYLQKRADYLRTLTHIVEIDLLRGGRRLPVNESFPKADYCAFVGRWDRRPQVEVYAWSLQDRLPSIPVPLREGDPDAWLNLQEALTRTYDRAGYDYTLDYDADVTPALAPADHEWARNILQRNE